MCLNYRFLRKVGQVLLNLPLKLLCEVSQNQFIFMTHAAVCSLGQNFLINYTKVRAMTILVRTVKSMDTGNKISFSLHFVVKLVLISHYRRIATLAL